jgi:hypothetical protein
MKQVYREREREREIRPSLAEPEVVELEAIAGSVGEALS